MMDELALGDYLDQAQHELFRLEVLDAYPSCGSRA